MLLRSESGGKSNLPQLTFLVTRHCESLVLFQIWFIDTQCVLGHWKQSPPENFQTPGSGILESLFIVLTCRWGKQRF